MKKKYQSKPIISYLRNLTQDTQPHRALVHNLAHTFRPEKNLQSAVFSLQSAACSLQSAACSLHASKDPLRQRDRRRGGRGGPRRGPQDGLGRHRGAGRGAPGGPRRRRVEAPAERGPQRRPLLGRRPAPRRHQADDGGEEAEDEAGEEKEEGGGGVLGAQHGARLCLGHVADGARVVGPPAVLGPREPALLRQAEEGLGEDPPVRRVWKQELFTLETRVFNDYSIVRLSPA